LKEGQNQFAERFVSALKIKCEAVEKHVQYQFMDVISQICHPLGNLRYEIGGSQLVEKLSYTFVSLMPNITSLRIGMKVIKNVLHDSV
jgi:hypothetical protein